MILVATVILLHSAGLAGSMPGGPGVPENITVTFLNPTTVRVSWDTSIQHVDKYDVTYKPTDARVVAIVAGNSDAVTLSGLKPDTQYQVTVAAVWAGRKFRSRPIVFRTLEPPRTSLYTDVTGTFATEPPSSTTFSEPPSYVEYPQTSSTVRGVEIGIVLLVLVVWIGAIALFFNRWGKIRMLLPYQPDYKRDQLKVPGTAACAAAVASGNTCSHASGEHVCTQCERWDRLRLLSKPPRKKKCKCKRGPRGPPWSRGHHHDSPDREEAPLKNERLEMTTAAASGTRVSGIRGATTIRKRATAAVSLRSCTVSIMRNAVATHDNIKDNILPSVPLAATVANCVGAAISTSKDTVKMISRPRLNSAIFTSFSGPGFDSKEFFRRHGSQSRLCRKARSVENMSTDNENGDDLIIEQHHCHHHHFQHHQRPKQQPQPQHFGLPVLSVSGPSPPEDHDDDSETDKFLK